MPEPVGQILKRMLHGDWQDPKHFDLVINTERVPVTEGVDLIEQTLQLPSFRDTDESKAKLTSLRIEHQLRTIMLTDPLLKSDSASINIAVNETTQDVILSGGVRHQPTRERMFSTAKSLNSIGDVVNEIALVRD